MKRQLCLCALFALVLVPDWVSACWPRGGEPVYYYPSHAPTYYYAPPVYCQPVYVQPCVPVTPPILRLPRIEPARPYPGSSLGDPRPIAQPNPPVHTHPAEIAPVRPAGGVEPPKLSKPEPAPAPKPEPPLVPDPPRIFAPEPDGRKVPALDPKKPAIEFPNISDPKNPTPEPKLPPLELPKDTAPKLPPLELPKVPDPKLPTLDANPKLPGLELPGAPAVPVPAPAPDALIPPSGLPVPKAADSLPPLTLPPDTPVTPDLRPTEVKSSPLGAVVRGPNVSVFPASGAAAANGLRKVGFYNHTDHDLSLTIEGQAVTLPAKTYLHAQLPATFTWKQGDRPAAKQTVPADAIGIDVLFR